jgi:hypothetical protein
VGEGPYSCVREVLSTSSVLSAGNGGSAGCKGFIFGESKRTLLSLYGGRLEGMVGIFFACFL